MTVASDYAAYLKADALYATVATANAAAWPDGVTLERTSAMATIDAGVGEAARQAAFLGGATVRDIAIVPGRRSDLLGRCIVGRHSDLGYAAGVAAFVIGVEEMTDGTTQLTVIRKL